MSQQKFGRYIIKGTLGRGAMGMVYLALDPILDRLSAIKVMNTGGEVDEGMRTRFFREAKSAARLRHPNIIAIYEMGEEGKRPFIAMEYVEGEDLKALIEKRTFIPFDQKIRILVQVCEGLSYAHQQGIIHRDIKPANIRIAQNGEVRILDFGLARLGSSDITRTGMLMGTPYYMSPEQVRGVRDLDGRSDLFSVAVLLYELLAYTRPFEAESSTEVCLKIVSECHTPLSSVLPKVDGDLEGILDRALSKNRDARQSGCQDLARSLKEYALTVPQRLKGLESEVDRLEKEWASCCEASQHLVQLGILEESLLAPLSPTPAPPIDPEETTVYNFSLEAAHHDFGALLLTHARLHGRLDEVRQRLRAAVPLQELLERGNHQIAQGELEDCMNTLAEILEMAPQNSRALDMQRECQRLLEERRADEERRARLKQALALASEAFEQGNLAQCIQSASRALQIDPGNNQALELKQQASDALVRRHKVAELLAAARGFHKAQNYESAYQVCEEALALDPGHAELRLIQQQSQQILTRQKQIRDWLNLAHEKLQAGDYLAVLASTDQLLKLEPDLPRALELQQQAAEALERQLKLEELLAVARGCEMAGDFEECLRTCEQALQIGPQNSEILDLRDRTSQALKTQRRVAELLSRVREEVARHEFGPAIETCREALGLDPANETAQELLKTAEAGCHRLHRVGELLALAQSQMAQRNFQACLDLTDEALVLDPLHQGLGELRRVALDSLGRLRQFEQHLEAARLGDEIEDYGRALHHLEQALELDDGNAAVLELKQQVAAKLDRRNQLSACLETARHQLQSENYAECLDSTHRAQQLDPANQEAHSLSSQATEALARLEQRLAALLANAEQRYQEQRFADALSQLNELLSTDASHAAAIRLKEKVSREWQKVQQIDRLLGEAKEQASHGNWEESKTKAQEGLKLAPGHQELQQLYDRSQRNIDKIKRISELLKNCRTLVQKRQFEAALPLASQILDLQPEHAEASELREKATAALERQRQIRQLLEAARAHEEAREFKLAVEKTQAGLDLEAHNSDFLSIQSRAVAAIEHQRRLSSLLSEARLQLNNHRYEASLQASEQLLKLERDHPEGQELKRAADEALERLRQLNQFLSEAKAKAKSGLWKDCLDIATEGLQLDPTHAELAQLASQASETLDKRRTLQELLDSGRGRFDRGEFDASLKSAERALQLDPDSAEATQLKLDSASALEARKKQERVAALLAQARKHELSGDVEACYRAASEGLTLEPEHAELKSLRDNSAHILETRRQIQILLERARQQWQAEDFTKVTETAVSILNLDPQNAKAADFKLKAEEELCRRERLKELLNEARRADKERDHEACLRAAEEGLTLNPGHPEFQRLQSRSRQIIDQIRRVSQLLQGARAEIEARNYTAALKALDAALKLEASNAEAAQLKQKTQEALERQKHLAGLLSNAQRQLKAGQFEECLKSAGQGLALDAGHPLFKELSVEAERQLEHRRQISEGLQRAAGHLEEKECQKAIEAYEFVLKLAPSQAQAVEGRRRAQEAWQREQRLEDCLVRAQAAFKAEDFEGCHAAAQEGLKLEPGHPALQDLAKQAVAIIERTRRVKQLWEEAFQSQQSGDLQACLHTLDQLLELEPENAPAQELRPKIVDSLERQRRATGLLAEAASLENSGDLEACQRLAEQALQTDPHHAQAQQLHRRISVALDRGRQIQKLLGQATQQFKEQDDDVGALKIVEEVLKLEPAQPRALEIQSLASKRLEHRTQVEQLLLQARKAEAARDPEKCLRAAEQGLQLEPDHVEFKKLEAQSRERLERQRKVRELVAECERQLNAGAFEASIAAAGSLESLDPGNTIAVEMRQKANDGLERRRRVQALLARALELSASGDLATCYSLCNEALQLDASNSELLELRGRAFEVLESRRREEELRARLQRLLASAKDSLQSGRFREVQKDLTALLKLDAAHAEACQLLAEAESQLALARQKNLRLAKLAAAAVLAVSLLGSGVWYAMQAWRQAPGAPSSQTTSGPRPPQPQPTTAQPSSGASAEDREIVRLLDTSRTLLNEKKYSEAEEAARQLLARSPNHEDAKKISQEARKNLDVVEEGLRRARILLDRRQYAEVASVLSGVLSVDADQPEALRMMAQVDKFAKKNAEEARQKMQQTKHQAGQAGAPTLVQSKYEIASVMESQARQLFEGKKYGEATGKFYEASDAYRIAAGGARAKAVEIARQPAAQEKPAGSSELPPAQAPGLAERQLQEERERQQQRNLAQSASNDYSKALSHASQIGADRLVPEIFQQATSLGTRAQEKFNQGNYAGAQSDFRDAIRQVENTVTRADDVARQRRDEEAKQKERIQTEQLAAQNRRQPPPQNGTSGQKTGDRELILQVLRRYEAAMNNRNIRELTEVRPGLAREEQRKIEASFKFAKSLRYELQPSGELRISEDSAVVNCRNVSETLIPNSSKPLKAERAITVILRKKGGNWIIETMQ